MIQIAAFTNKPDGAVSLYRAHGPFSKMRKTCDFIELPYSVSWDQLSKFDIVFMSKPCAPDSVHICETAKALGIPIWLDFDDDVFAIEPSNNEPYLLYSNPNTMETVRRVIELSSVITVSTKALLERFKPFEKPVILIENATMHSLVPSLDTSIIHRRNRIGLWRGGFSHKYAIQAHESCIGKMLDERQDLVMLWLGNWPAMLLETHAGRNLLEPGKAWFEYFKLLKERRAMFQLVLLNDCEFDHAKSHNAWLESIMIGGSICLAPEGFDEFTNRPGIFHYTKENLHEVVARVMELGERELENIVFEAKRFIEGTYSLDLMNRKRLRVLDFLQA